MSKKALFLLTAALSISLISFSQDFRQRFKTSSINDDTVGMLKVLKEWEAARPQDAEMFIGYFNYYAIMAAREIVSLNPENKGTGGFQLTDSTGKTVGYLNSSLKYDSRVLQQGFNYIDKGIALHPTRLDMRFGRVHMLGKAENYAAFTKTIIDAIHYGNTIKLQWLWREGKPLENQKEFVLSTIQSYIRIIYNTENDNLLPFMRQISEAVIKYYPDHVESLANIALTYIVVGEYDKGLPYLLMAEKVAPNDVVVINNIAQVYKRKDDKANAKIYFEKMVKYGNKKDVEMAKKELKELE